MRFLKFGEMSEFALMVVALNFRFKQLQSIVGFQSFGMGHLISVDRVYHFQSCQ
jgi:hypothetical protein